MWILITAIAFLAGGEDDAVQAALLRARGQFEIGDYPAAEKTLRVILDHKELGVADEVQCLTRLAQVLSLEDAHEAALETLRRALDRGTGRGPAVPGMAGPAERVAISRVGIPIALRAVRYGEAAELAAAVLEREPDDPLARFARGIGLAKEGRNQDAISDLERGLRIPGLWRDARFELALAEGKSGHPGEALAHLLEILLKDPWDEEACYQATRQLIRSGNRQAVATAAHLMRYLESLKEASGPSSRDHHYQAAGLVSFAALLRAAKRERLGDFERMIEEIRKAESPARGDAVTLLAAADSWARLGLLREAERVLDGVPDRGPAERVEASPGARNAREEIEKRKEALRAAAATPLGRASLLVAEAPFAEAGPRLEKLLEAARAAHADPVASRVARLLLAIDPRSPTALRHLVEITRDPALLVPHLHYLSRLASCLPQDRSLRSELLATSAVFLGKEPGSGK